MGAPAGGLLLLDMRRQCAKRREDALVLFVVRAQLEPVALADGERKLQRVDRIQAQARVEQRCFGINLASGDILQIQAFYQQLGQLQFGVGLRRHPGIRHK